MKIIMKYYIIACACVKKIINYIFSGIINVSLLIIIQIVISALSRNCTSEINWTIKLVSRSLAILRILKLPIEVSLNLWSLDKNTHIQF